MHTASDIAKWFLQRNDIEMKLRDSEYISHLKLQKLLYYAQGVFSAFHGGELLFNDDLVAWSHGPVVEAVYHEYKSYGSRGIDVFAAPNEEYLPHEESILEMVYANFAQYSAWMLREMTHKERPWKETPSSGVISTALICDFFKEEYVENE